MNVKIYGSGCAKCRELERRVREVVEAEGVSAEIEHVTDVRAIAAAGIMSTPGLAVGGVIKSTGRIPSVDEIRTWIRERA
jgi:small redox-active disulfide protein 2